MSGSVFMPDKLKLKHQLTPVIRFFLVFAWAAVAHAEIAVRWVGTDKPIVLVTGLTAPIKPEALSVYADQGDLKADMSLPAMLGRYWTEQGRLYFEPHFPLERGVNYRAVFRPDAKAAPIIVSFKLPVQQIEPTTVVTRIYPSADVLPENLLKFYVHFSAPMSRGRIYEHIHLLDERGKDVELPFLEIDEELWDPHMKRLTLFIDPGRIKRGVQPLEEIGPALEEGKAFTLIIDQAWRDSAGHPLKESFRKKFKVGPPDREPPEPLRWKIHAPSAGTREPLRVDFLEPMDHALALRMIGVANVGGTAVLEEHEQAWKFVPATAWHAGLHKLRVQTTIEDLAGNNIGKPFEVDEFEAVQRRITNSIVEVPFQIPQHKTP
jgi:hypothetical protein